MADDFFDEDPFGSIMREFFSSPISRKKRLSTRVEEESGADFVETKNKFYVIFDLPGFFGKEISVSVKNRDVEVRAQKKGKDTVSLSKTLPDFVNSKKFSHVVKNGVLEVVFEKK